MHFLAHASKYKEQSRKPQAKLQALRIDGSQIAGVLLGWNKWAEGACDISGAAGTAFSDDSRTQNKMQYLRRNAITDLQTEAIQHDMQNPIRMRVLFILTHEALESISIRSINLISFNNKLKEKIMQVWKNVMVNFQF